MFDWLGNLVAENKAANVVMKNNIWNLTLFIYTGIHRDVWCTMVIDE